ncbi:unnamed protein product, partial [Amoebophrya sp. A25]|eukprot:GSA25T00021331001.1
MVEVEGDGEGRTTTTPIARALANRLRKRVENPQSFEPKWAVAKLRVLQEQGDWAGIRSFIGSSGFSLKAGNSTTGDAPSFSTRSTSSPQAGGNNAAIAADLGAFAEFCLSGGVGPTTDAESE